VWAGAPRVREGEAVKQPVLARRSTERSPSRVSGRPAGPAAPDKTADASAAKWLGASTQCIDVIAVAIVSYGREPEQIRAPSTAYSCRRGPRL
jgi:hypothetical protein